MALHCPYCFIRNLPDGSRPDLVRTGSFIRQSDLTRQQRYRCRPCGKTFSSASFELCYRQKKRYLNPKIFKYLASGVSQRRLAILLGINRKTVVRKFLFVGLHSYHAFVQNRQTLPPVHEMEFDDLETFEHSKMKPLSVIMAVESKTRRILGFRVARMPAKGLLVKRALKKYGPRLDERAKARQQLFQELRSVVTPTAEIRSDENPHYKKPIKDYFPKATHITSLGRRGCVVGQGELKGGGYDPLFSLNHSFAMLRANINRLFRRTWNTTKKPERLALHIAMYALYHNLVLI